MSGSDCSSIRARSTWLETPLDDLSISRTAADASAAEPTVQPTYESTVSEKLDLDRALALLPAQMRLCIVLAYWERMSHREITDATGFPLGTVKSHIARGAARLREILTAYG